MHNRGKSGDQLGFKLALSPTEITAGGSTNVFDVAQFGWMTLQVIASGAGLTAVVEGSNASNGTFVPTGLSLTTAASQMALRSARIGFDQQFVRVAYDDNGNGVTATLALILDESKTTPIVQESDVVVHSSII